MPKGRCEKCGQRYAGWALNQEAQRRCECGGDVLMEEEKMLKTTEAREKICPLLMVGFMAAPVGAQAPDPAWQCQADDCMLWRRGVYEVEAEYCGLAGNPFATSMVTPSTRKMYAKDGES